jgi:hypothetical protein
MRLPHDHSADVIREIARLASQSKDNSLFSLLLLLEAQDCGDAFDSEVKKSRRSSVPDPQPALFATHSRYVE